METYDEKNIQTNQNYLPLEEIGLSHRSYNALRREGIHTLEQLLEFMREKSLSDIRNLGATSVKEITDIVERIIRGEVPEKRDKTISEIFCGNKFAMFRNYCDEHGIVTIDDVHSINLSALMQIKGFGAGKIDAVIKRLEEYEGTRYTADAFDRPKQTFESIHSSNNNLPIEVMQHFGLGNTIIRKLQDFGIFYIAQLSEFSKDAVFLKLNTPQKAQLEKVLELLKEPLHSITTHLFEELATDKQFEIYLLRAKGDSLQKIGECFGLTRERVRQICQRFERICREFITALIQAEEEKNTAHYVSEEQVLNIFDNDNYDCIVVSVLKNSQEYTFFAGIFYNVHYYPDVSAEMLRITSEIVGEGISLFQEVERIESILEANGYGFLSVEDFLNIIISLNYCIYGDYIVKNKKSYGYLCAQIAEKFFPQGISNNSEDLSRLRRLVHEKFGDLDLPDIDRSLWTRLCAYLVQRGRSVYISPQRIRISQALLEEIKEYIDNSSLSEIFFRELFSVFEEKLSQFSNIDNASFLHGVIAYYYPNEYVYTRDSLQKNAHSQDNGLEDRIFSYIASCGSPVTMKQLTKEFQGLAESMLVQTIFFSKRIVQWDYGWYNCAANINIAIDERDFLKSCIEHFVSENGYCNEYMIYESTRDKLADIYFRNQIHNSHNLFYMLSVIFDGDYDFRRPHITAKGRFPNLSTRGIVTQLLGASEYFYLDQFDALVDSLKLSDVTTAAVYTEIEKDYLRVSYNEYIHKKVFSVGDADVAAVKVLLEREAGDLWYYPLQRLCESSERIDESQLINGFFVEAIVLTGDTGWRVIYPKVKDRRYQRGILIRNDVDIYEYDELISAILKENQLFEVTESQLLTFLKKNKLATKVIPKEILASALFHRDPDGVLRVYR